MMKNKKYRYYLIYQITNLINNKIYIGMHCTNDVSDGYMGSGYALKTAFKKYGKDKFKKEILFEFDNPEEMIRKEEEIVNRDFVSRKDVYNIHAGGVGYARTGEHHSDISREKMKGRVPVIDSDGNRFKVSTNDPRYLSGELVCVAKGRKHSQEFKDRMSIIAKSRSPMSDETKKKIGESVSGEKNGFYGKAHSEETKVKISKKNSEILKGRVFSESHRKNLSASSTKEKNSGFGKVWVSNMIEFKLKRIDPCQVQEYLDNGWILGRKAYHKK